MSCGRNVIVYIGIEDTLSFSTEKAESIGYRFRELKEWLYPLIDFKTATSN